MTFHVKFKIGTYTSGDGSVLVVTQLEESTTPRISITQFANLDGGMIFVITI